MSKKMKNIIKPLLLMIIIFSISGIAFSKDIYIVNLFGFKAGIGTPSETVPIISGFSFFRFGYINQKTRLGFGFGLAESYFRDDINGMHYGQSIVMPLYLYCLVANKVNSHPLYLYIGGGYDPGPGDPPMNPNSKIFEFGIVKTYSKFLDVRLGYLSFSVDSYDYDGKHNDAVKYDGIQLAADIHLGWNWGFKYDGNRSPDKVAVTSNKEKKETSKHSDSAIKSIMPEYITVDLEYYKRNDYYMTLFMAGYSFAMMGFSGNQELSDSDRDGDRFIAAVTGGIILISLFPKSAHNDTEIFSRYYSYKFQKSKKPIKSDIFVPSRTKRIAWGLLLTFSGYYCGNIEYTEENYAERFTPESKGYFTIASVFFYSSGILELYDGLFRKIEPTAIKLNPIASSNYLGVMLSRRF